MSLFKGLKQIPKPGTTAPVTHLTWTRAGGEARQVWYKGNFADMYAKLQANKAYFDSASISQVGEGTMYKLELAQAGDDITEVHDVGGSDLLQSKIFNLYLQGQIVAETAGSSIPATDESVKRLLAQIAQEVSNYKSDSSNDYAQLVSNIEELTDAPSALALADELIRLGDNFLQAQYNYVHTVCVAERVYLAGGYREGNIYADVGKIFTEDQVRDAEGITAEMNFHFPPKIVDGSPAEWLKRPPHSTLTSGQKRVFLIPYLFADTWSRLDYEEA